MFKRLISKLLVIVVICIILINGLFLMGFATSEKEEVNLWFLAMAPGTSQYNFVASMTQIISKEFHPNSKIEVVPRGGAFSSPLVVNDSGADFGITTSHNLEMAYKGIGNYEGRGQATNIRLVTGVLDKVYVWVMALNSYVKRTGFTTLEEMFAVSESEWPRVGMKPMGSAVIPIADMMFRDLGTSLEGLRAANKLIQAQPTQLGEMLRDGRLDVYIDTTSLNHPALTETALTNDIFWMQTTKQTKDFLLENGFVMEELPDGTYKGMVDYEAPVTGDVLITHKDIPEDTIYLCTKALVEGRDELVENNVALAEWAPEDYQTSTTVPMHPGAKRYYEERGW